MKITFSQQYYDLLMKVVKVAKPGCTLLYKENGRCRISIPNQALFTHISAGPADLDFEGDHVNIFSLAEFAKYAEAINYPTMGSIDVSAETSITGRKYEYIKFTSPRLTCRTITADPSCFTKADHNTPKDRDKDPMTRLAQIAFNDDSLKDFQKNLKLVPDCKFVTLMITDEVRFYIKGKLSQQITYTMDETNTRYIDDVAVNRVFTPGKIIMFPAMYFNIMKGIGGSYEIDIRNVTNSKMNMSALKGFSSIPGANPDDPIQLMVGASEATAAAIGNYDLVV